MVQEVVLTPDYRKTVRFLARGLRYHSFTRGLADPVVSFIEHVRYLQQTDPQEVQRIIDELTKKG